MNNKHERLYHFTIGDIVWAELDIIKIWPAIVLNIEGQDRSGSSQHRVTPKVLVEYIYHGKGREHLELRDVKPFLISTMLDELHQLRRKNFYRPEIDYACRIAIKILIRREKEHREYPQEIHRPIMPKDVDNTYPNPVIMAGIQSPRQEQQQQQQKGKSPSMLNPNANIHMLGATQARSQAQPIQGPPLILPDSGPGLPMKSNHKAQPLSQTQPQAKLPKLQSHPQPQPPPQSQPQPQPQPSIFLSSKISYPSNADYNVGLQPPLNNPPSDIGNDPLTNKNKAIYPVLNPVSPPKLKHDFILSFTPKVSPDCVSKMQTNTANDFANYLHTPFMGSFLPGEDHNLRQSFTRSKSLSADRTDSSNPKNHPIQKEDIHITERKRKRNLSLSSKRPIHGSRNSKHQDIFLTQGETGSKLPQPEEDPETIDVDAADPYPLQQQSHPLVIPQIVASRGGRKAVKKPVQNNLEQQPAARSDGTVAVAATTVPPPPTSAPPALDPAPTSARDPASTLVKQHIYTENTTTNLPGPPQTLAQSISGISKIDVQNFTRQCETFLKKYITNLNEIIKFYNSTAQERNATANELIEKICELSDFKHKLSHEIAERKKKNEKCLETITAFQNMAKRG